MLLLAYYALSMNYTLYSILQHIETQYRAQRKTEPIIWSKCGSRTIQQEAKITGIIDMGTLSNNNVYTITWVSPSPGAGELAGNSSVECTVSRRRYFLRPADPHIRIGQCTLSSPLFSHNVVSMCIWRSSFPTFWIIHTVFWDDYCGPDVTILESFISL